MAKTKHDLRSEATRRQLVSAARALFGGRGYADVGTEEIVRSAGVTRGALYHQFRDKADLFAAVAEEVEAEIAERIATGAAGAADDPMGALRAGVRLFLDACAEPEVERIILLDAAHDVRFVTEFFDFLEHGGFFFLRDVRFKDDDHSNKKPQVVTCGGLL